jgi:hypothetical protein
MGRQSYTVEQFLIAIPKTGGIVSTIAQRVGCSWATARKFIDTHPTVLSAYRDECESVIDMAESKLINAMNNDDIDSIKWYLARKGKHRGFSERLELSGLLKLIDYSKLTDEQLERLANGDNPIDVLLHTGAG